MNIGETTVKKTYNINGVEYENFEDIPRKFRKLLEDKNGNNIPDIVEERKAELVETSTVYQNSLGKEDIENGSAFIKNPSMKERFKNFLTSIVNSL